MQEYTICKADNDDKKMITLPSGVTFFMSKKDWDNIRKWRKRKEDNFPKFTI